MKPVTAEGVFLISRTRAPRNFAGKECNPNFFVTSYQNDQNDEVLGKYATDFGKTNFPDRPELPGGQGCDGRVQAHLRRRIC